MKIKQMGVPGVEAGEIEPAYFTALRIKNFRCFGEEQTLNLCDASGHPARWTVIVGENGVGKTTLLQCLAGLAAEYVVDPASPQGSKERKGGRSIKYVLSPKLGTMPMIPYLQAGTRQRGLEIRVEGAIAVGQSLSDPTAVRANSFSQWGAGLTPAADSKTSFSFNLSWDPKLRLGGLICYGYGAGYRLATTARDEKVPDDHASTLFNLRGTLPNTEEWLLNLDHVAKTDGPGKQRAEKNRDRVLEILANVLPDVAAIRFGINDDTGKIRPIFVIPYGAVSLDQLGLGFQSMIAWIADLVRRLFHRYPESADPLAEPAIALIDELDLHLHPAWQRKVMSYLSNKFPGTQFVATVHGPLVVQTAAETANIVVLRRMEGADGKEQVIIDNHPENVRGWRMDQILTSDLFGLPIRSDRAEQALHRRKTLLTRTSLTRIEEKELRDLEREVARLPTEERSEDRKAMDIIDRAAELLGKLK